jgi:hypothetical protein
MEQFLGGSGTPKQNEKKKTIAKLFKNTLRYSYFSYFDL